MEEEKAAAYYNELTRKGEGAARFKQGLGFSSSAPNDNSAVPTRGSALPSTSSSFLSSFVKASSTPSNDSEVQKQAQLESIQSKLKKKPHNLSESSSRVSNDRSRDVSRDNDRNSRRRSRSRDNDRNSRRRSRSRDSDRSRHRHRRRSRDRDEDRDRYRKRERRKSRSRSRSISDEERGRRGRGRRRSSSPPRDRRSEKSRTEAGKDRNDKKIGVDYAKLIDGYDKMTEIYPPQLLETLRTREHQSYNRLVVDYEYGLDTPAERVKAKMKLQLSETAKNDATNGMGSGWERFDFDKDAPLDDEEVEAGDDDIDLVKHIGQSFRLQAVEARREERIKATHDEAIFGTPSLAPSVDTDSEEEGDKYKRETAEPTPPVASLISDQVRAKQGSWRDRVRKL